MRKVARDQKIPAMYEKYGGEGIKRFFFWNGISEKSVLGKFILRIWLFGYYVFMPLPRAFLRFLRQRRFSPFIKEWIYSFFKWCIFVPLLFTVFIICDMIDPLEGPLSDIVVICFVKTPSVIAAITFLLMRTPRRELADLLFLYRSRRRKKVGIISLESFKTTFEFDFEEVDILSYIYHLDRRFPILLPVMFYCKELPPDHRSRSLAPQFDLNVYAAWDWLLSEDEEGDYSEYHHPFVNNDACSEDDLKAGKIHLKAAFSPQVLDLFVELTKKEPTMEFEVEYLFFSKLVTGIYPIEGYDYPKGVTELLDKLNAVVNPWIKRKKRK